MTTNCSASLGNKARKDPKRVVFAEAENVKILKAAQIVLDDGIAYPILLGEERKIRRLAETNNIDLEGIPIIDPRADELEAKGRNYADYYFKKRQRRGVNQYEAYKSMRDRIRFACMMLETGEADAVIRRAYPQLSRNRQAGAAGDWHRKGSEKNCRHVYHAHQTRARFSWQTPR